MNTSIPATVIGVICVVACFTEAVPGGSSTRRLVGDDLGWEFHYFGSPLRGNVLEVDEAVRLDAFSVDVSTTAPCVVDLYVHRSTDRGERWSVVWAGEVSTSRGAVDVASGRVGHAFEAGDWVALSAGLHTLECGDGARFRGGASKPGDRVGPGRWRAAVRLDDYSGFDATGAGLPGPRGDAYGYVSTATFTPL